MFSTIELYRAIRERLTESFPNVLIQQKDIKNITRPAFYIQYVGKNIDKQAQEYFEDRILFNIIYYAQNESLLELLEVEETFTMAFNTPLTVADDTNVVEVEKESIQSNLNEEDYYLNLTIDFVLMQREIKAETGDDMEYIGVEIDNEKGQKIDEGDEEQNVEYMEDIEDDA
jgi:hypothetical protein